MDPYVAAPDVRLGQGSGERRQGLHAGSLTGNPNFHQTINPSFLPSFVVSLETTPTNVPRGEAPNGPFVPLLAARETKKNAYAMRISAFSADAPNELSDLTYSTVKRQTRRALSIRAWCGVLLSSLALGSWGFRASAQTPLTTLN